MSGQNLPRRSIVINGQFSHNEFRNHVMYDMIYPELEETMIMEIKWRKLWHKISQVCYILTFLIISVNTVLAFLSSHYSSDLLSTMAGCVGLAAMSCDRFAHYCHGRSMNNNKKLNSNLAQIGLHFTMPDLAEGGDAPLQQTNQSNPQQSSGSTSNSSSPVTSPATSPTNSSAPTVPIVPATSTAPVLKTLQIRPSVQFPNVQFQDGNNNTASAKSQPITQPITQPSVRSTVVLSVDSDSDSDGNV